MGAELSRKRRGKKTRTGMSESNLEDFTSKSMGDVVEKNIVKAISKYLGKTDEDFKTALDAFSTKPKTPKEAAAAVGDRRKYDEAAAKITPPKRVVAVEKGIGDIARKLTGQKPKQAPTPTPEKPPRFAGYASAGYPQMGSVDKQEVGEAGKFKIPVPPPVPINTARKLKRDKQLVNKENGYPPTKGERRDAKRTKAKKMKVTGAGAKNLQRIIGAKAEAAGGGVDKAAKGSNVEKSIVKAITKFLGKQAPGADPEAAKRAANRAQVAAGAGKPPPAPFVHTTPDPLTGKKPAKKPKPSWGSFDRPEGAQRGSSGQGGGMAAVSKKRDKQLIKAISTYLKEDTPKYNKKAVDSAIKRDKSIGKKEAKAIHGLLRGRQKSDS